MYRSVCFLFNFHLVPNACRLDTLLSPMILHTPHPDETHYFPLHHSPDRRILLHTHSPAPFIDSWVPAARPGLNFTVYSVVRETCGPLILTVEIDWSATVGRWVIRYPTTVVIWSTGITALLMFNAWGIADKTRGGRVNPSKIH